MVWNAIMEDEEVQTLIPKEIDSKNAQTWSDMGIELYKMRKYKEALVSFDRALRIDSYNYDALKFKSKIFFTQKKIKESVDCLDRILTKYPNADEILFIKGTRHSAWLVNVKTAIDCFEKAIKIKPDNTMYSYWLTQVLNDYGEFKKALEVANKLLALKPDSEPVNYCKIHILGNLEKYEEQIFQCDVWLEQKPKDKAIMHVKANALANLKKFKDAVIWYDNAWRDHKVFYGLKNKKRALDAINTGKVSDLPFTFHSNGEKMELLYLFKSRKEKEVAWTKMREIERGK